MNRTAALNNRQRRALAGTVWGLRLGFAPTGRGFLLRIMYSPETRVAEIETVPPSQFERHFGGRGPQPDAREHVCWWQSDSGREIARELLDEHAPEGSENAARLTRTRLTSRILVTYGEDESLGS